jgi:hypothetical protein
VIAASPGLERVMFEAPDRSADERPRHHRQSGGR